MVSLVAVIIPTARINPLVPYAQLSLQGLRLVITPSTDRQSLYPLPYPLPMEEGHHRRLAKKSLG